MFLSLVSNLIVIKIKRQVTRVLQYGGLSAKFSVCAFVEHLFIIESEVL